MCKKDILDGFDKNYQATGLPKVDDRDRRLFLFSATKTYLKLRQDTITNVLGHLHSTITPLFVLFLLICYFHDQDEYYQTKQINKFKLNFENDNSKR